MFITLQNAWPSWLPISKEAHIFLNKHSAWNGMGRGGNIDKQILFWYLGSGVHSVSPDIFSMTYRLSPHAFLVYDFLYQRNFFFPFSLPWTLNSIARLSQYRSSYPPEWPLISILPLGSLLQSHTGKSACFMLFKSNILASIETVHTFKVSVFLTECFWVWHVLPSWWWTAGWQEKWRGGRGAGYLSPTRCPALRMPELRESLVTVRRIAIVPKHLKASDGEDYSRDLKSKW